MKVSYESGQMLCVQDIEINGNYHKAEKSCSIEFPSYDSYVDDITIYAYNARGKGKTDVTDLYTNEQLDNFASDLRRLYEAGDI